MGSMAAVRTLSAVDVLPLTFFLNQMIVLQNGFRKRRSEGEGAGQMREKSEEAVALMQPDDAWKMLRLPRLVQVVRKRCILTDHLHRLFQHVGGEYGGGGEGMAFRHDGKGFEAGDDFSGKRMMAREALRRQTSRIASMAQLSR